MRAWKCKQVVGFDKSTTTVKEERNKTLQLQMTDKYNRFQVVTILTESFSPLRSVLHNLPCWSLKQKWCDKLRYSHLSCATTDKNRSELATTNRAVADGLKSRLMQYLAITLTARTWKLHFVEIFLRFDKILIVSLFSLKGCGSDVSWPGYSTHNR